MKGKERLWLTHVGQKGNRGRGGPFFYARKKGGNGYWRCMREKLFFPPRKKKKEMAIQVGTIPKVYQGGRGREKRTHPFSVVEGTATWGGNEKVS